MVHDRLYHSPQTARPKRLTLDGLTIYSMVVFASRAHLSGVHTRAALAFTLARATVWCEVARLCAASGGGGLAVVVLALQGLRWLLRRRLPCSLYSGCAGFYAGVRHGVARGGTCVHCLGRR